MNIIKIYSKRKFILCVLICFIVITTYVVIKENNRLLCDVPFSRVFYDRDGTLLRLTLSPDEKYRLLTPLNRIPEQLIKSILLKEDQYFYLHPGVNPVSLIRAFTETYIIGSKKMGGSTITMQLARLYYKLNTKTIYGKLIQIYHAIKLNLLYSKRRILEAYINLVPCGRNIEGYPAASLVYFNQPLKRLSLSEVLLLTVIPQDPNSRTPNISENNIKLIDAQGRLVKEWKKRYGDHHGFRYSSKLPVTIKKNLPFFTPHFVESLIKRSDIPGICYTTINLDIQKLVEQHAVMYVERRKHMGLYNTAVQIVDYKTMDLLASIGSIDYFNDKICGQVDGTRAYRSPGSTLKPFIYARAIDMGLIHQKIMLKDAPTSFNEYTPDNFQSDFKGPISAEQALVTSRNIPALSLASEIHNPDLYDIMKRIGIPLKSRDHYGLSIVLGCAEVRMIDLITLYACIANRGITRRINVLKDSKQNEGFRLFSPEASFITLDILKQNPRPKSNLKKYSLYPDEPVAFKTGTSIGFKDGWSIGIFDNMIIAVWVGNFSGYGNTEFVGRKAAVPLMFEIIDSLRNNNLSEKSLPLFSPYNLNVKLVDVCSISGMIPAGHCKNTVKTWFIPGISPIKKCDIHRMIFIDPATGFRTAKQTENAKPEVWEFWPQELLSLFKEAGMPRKLPPPFAPSEKYSQDQPKGYNPKIQSPLGNIEYIMRFNDDRNRIPLRSFADGDVQLLYWFVDTSYLGSAYPDQTIFWNLKPGKRSITVVDDKGRSCSRNINVILEK